jgi:PAS domain S-box-containing protein
MPASLDFRAVFARSPNPYMLLDRELRYVAANAAYLKVTGARLENLLGRMILDVYPNDPGDPNNESARQLRESLEKVLRTGAPDAIALIRYRVPRDGEATGVADRYWSATHTPILDDRGEVQYILQHTVDVTGLHASRPAISQVEAGVLDRAQRVQEANRALDAERRHFSELFEQAPGFMAFLRGADYVIENANAACLNLVGRHRDIVGRPLREALPELVEQRFFERLTQVHATGQPAVGRGSRVLLQRRAGAPPEEVFADFIFQPIVEPDGTVMGILVQGHDITEQKRLESELATRIEFDRQLVGIVSHDLRNPLNAIGVGASLLKTGSLTEQQSKVLDRMISAFDRAVRLIRDLLDFTQARGSGGIPVSPADASIREIVHSACDEVQLSHPDRQCLLRHSGRDVGRWDADRLAQLVGNLVSNAFEHSPAASPVIVATDGRPEALLLTVHNIGDPIPEAERARLFQPFERGRDSKASAQRSLGLGLYISKQIVAAHGGTIAVRSSPEQGTTFEVRLPYAIMGGSSSAQ